MRALTLIRPWDMAILYGGKRTENRTWCPPADLLGETIALHAGKKYDEQAHRQINEVEIVSRGWNDRTSYSSAIVGTARIIGWYDSRPGTPTHELSMFHVVAAKGKLVECQRRGHVIIDDLDPWWMGPVGWFLDDVRPLSRPLACKGMLGLWTLAPELESAVRKQMEAA